MISFFKKWINKKVVSIVKQELELQLSVPSKQKEKKYRIKYKLPDSFRFGRIEAIFLSGENISIGENTYINTGMIQAGKESSVRIGEWCAIAYNVSIVAVTHDTDVPTGPPDSRKVIEGDISIGDRVWIGSNVYIREGVTIGNDVVVGANSVVTKNIPDNAIVGGVPAKILRNK